MCCIDRLNPPPEPDIHTSKQMQQSDTLTKLDALLMRSDPDDMDWGEYEYQDGEDLLGQLTDEDRTSLLRSAATKPTNWRGCLVSILRPSLVDEGDQLISALWDPDENVVSEAMHRLYFYCGFIGSAKNGVFEDARRRVGPFWYRVRTDRVVLERLESLARFNAWADYWIALSGVAAAEVDASR